MARVSNAGSMGGYDTQQRWYFNDTLHGPCPEDDNAFSLGSASERALINGYLPTNLQTVIGAGAALHTSTVATDILGSAIGGSKTVAAAALNAIGRGLRFELGGVHGTTGTPTLLLEVLLGTTPILTTGVVTLVAVTGPLSWTARGQITVVSTGATGTVNGGGFVLSNVTPFNLTAVSGAVVTIDLTAAQIFKLRATWGTSSSSNTITQTYGSIEVFGSNATA